MADQPQNEKSQDKKPAPPPPPPYREIREGVGVTYRNLYDPPNAPFGQKKSPRTPS